MKFRNVLLAAALGALAFAANATDFAVNAYANSSSGGTALGTIALTSGEAFTVSVDPSQLWSAGALPRWSNADGLTGNLYATGTDASRQPAGTLIGQSFGTYTQGNLTAAYGALVGQIGGGNYFLVGTNYSGVASANGTLNLYYWDSNYADNTGSITAHVAAVPEPASAILLVIGLMGLMAFRRRING